MQPSLEAKESARLPPGVTFSSMILYQDVRTWAQDAPLTISGSK